MWFENTFLARFDNEENEIILRYRLWKMKWFPYRTAELLGFDEETDDLILGPWKWNRPDKFRKR